MKGREAERLNMTLPRYVVAQFETMGLSAGAKTVFIQPVPLQPPVPLPKADFAL
jgi:hypothetical protein